MGSNRLSQTGKSIRNELVTDVKPLPYSIIPEMRLTREASLTWGRAHGLIDEWDEYCNGVGKINKQLGNARAFGSLALTYVSAQDFGVMLARKHPDLYEPGNVYNTCKRLIKIQRDYATTFNKKIRYWRQNEIILPIEKLELGLDAAIEQALTSTRIEVLHEIEDDTTEGDQYDTENCEEVMPDHTYDLANSALWAEGGFLTNDTRLIGGKMKAGETRITKRAIDLSRNPELITEWNTIRTWLNDNGLDTRRMGEFTPHVTFFDGIYNLTQLALKSSVKMPEEIGLERPRIITNHEVIKTLEKVNRGLKEEVNN